MSASDPRTGTTPSTAPNGQTDDPEALREEIEHTREDLGETMSALSDKTDVKAQASAKADELKVKAQEATDSAKAQAQDNPMPFVLGAVGVLMMLVVLRKLRRRRRAARLERLTAELAERTMLVQANPRIPTAA